MQHRECHQYGQRTRVAIKVYGFSSTKILFAYRSFIASPKKRFETKHELKNSINIHSQFLQMFCV